MGKIIKKRIEYGGSSNSAENIKYDDTKNVKEAINEVGNLLGNTDISSIGDGTVTGGLDALNSNLMNQMVYLWEVGGSTGSKQIDLSQYRFVLITIMVAGFTTQCMLKPSNIQSSSALGYQTQVGVNTANGYVTVNITYDGTTFVFSCDSTIILDVIGIN